jgi:hypothetical protein
MLAVVSNRTRHFSVCFASIFKKFYNLPPISHQDLDHQLCKTLFNTRRYDSLGLPPGPARTAQDGQPGQEDLGRWGHHVETSSLEDEVTISRTLRKKYGG